MPTAVPTGSPTCGSSTPRDGRPVGARDQVRRPSCHVRARTRARRHAVGLDRHRRRTVPRSDDLRRRDRCVGCEGRRPDGLDLGDPVGVEVPRRGDAQRVAPAVARVDAEHRVEGLRRQSHPCDVDVVVRHRLGHQPPQPAHAPRRRQVVERGRSHAATVVHAFRVSAIRDGYDPPSSSAPTAPRPG